VLFDRGRPPITQYPPAALRQAEERYVRDVEYKGVLCDSGVFLLVSQYALARDGALRQVAARAGPPLAQFDGSISLADSAMARNGDQVLVNLTWRSTGRGYPDLQVFVHLLDSRGRILAQSDIGPQHGLCPTSAWSPDLAVLDSHSIALPAGSGQVNSARVGLYELGTSARLPRTDASSAGEQDYVDIQWNTGAGR
jgi:hypothetical protein